MSTAVKKQKKKLSLWKQIEATGNILVGETGVMVSDTPGAGNPHFRDLQTIENDVRKTEKA